MNIKKEYLILDCFIDEPACFGVPPFVSPYPRYIYGALIDAGVDSNSIKFITINAIRETNYRIFDDYEIIFLIGGAVVPGKYLGSRIGSRSEIKRILQENKKLSFAIGGLISHIIDGKQFNNFISIKGDIEKFAYEYAKGNPIDQSRNYREVNKWANYGAGVVNMHPDYPNLICEIETYRGCPRKTHCSFCSESSFNKIDFRDEKDILNEIDELIKYGIKRFRIGRQADILQYKTKFLEFKRGFPRPNPGPVQALFSQLKDKIKSGEIITLNIDNANPGTIFNFPEESSLILQNIVDAITPGDTLALGVESFDPEVIKKNNLKVNKDELIEVIRIINEIGGKRIYGIPILLPGINLIHGLIGENKNTFKINYEALTEIKDKGLLLKRINIRKLLPFPDTIIYDRFKNMSQLITNRYKFYKGMIRKDIDNFMLKQIYPVGTILKDMKVEEIRFDYSYAKQIASYSVTTKIPLSIKKNTFIDTMVISHRERSIIALPYPISINSLPEKAVRLIPGFGVKRAARIILERPFKHHEEIKNIIPNLDEKILNAIVL